MNMKASLINSLCTAILVSLFDCSTCFVLRERIYYQPQHLVLCGSIQDEIAILKEQIGDLKKSFGDQDKRIGDLKKSFGDQDKRIGDQDKRIGDLKKSFGDQDKRIGDQDKDIKGLKNHEQIMDKDIEGLENRFAKIDKGFSRRSIATKLEKIILTKIGDESKGLGDFLKKYKGKNAQGKQLMLVQWNNAMPKLTWTIDKIEELSDAIASLKGIANWFGHDAQPSESFDQDDFDDISNWFAHDAQPSESFDQDDFDKLTSALSEYDDVTPALEELRAMVFAISDAIKVQIEDIIWPPHHESMNLRGCAEWVEVRAHPFLGVGDLLMVEIPTPKSNKNWSWKLLEFLAEKQNDQSFPPCKFYVGADPLETQPTLLYLGFEIPPAQAKNQTFVEKFVQEVRSAQARANS